MPPRNSVQLAGRSLELHDEVADNGGDMDVARIASRVARMAFPGAGLVAGLVLALPVRTGSVACPPAREGRVNCLVQHAWAPAFVKLAAALLVAYLLHDALCRRLPAAVRRWRAGERVIRRGRGFGREAVLADSVLAAASWGVVPESRRRLLRRHEPSGPIVVAAPPAAPAPAVRPTPAPASAEPETVAPEPGARPAAGRLPLSAFDRLLARAVAEEAPAEHLPSAAEPGAADPVALEPVPSEPAVASEPALAEPEPEPLRPLTTADRLAHLTDPLAAHLRIIGQEEGRSRRLRPLSDPALTVALFSDVSAAEGQAEDLGVSLPAPVAVPAPT